MYRLILIAFLMVGCGEQEPARTGIDPELAPYVEAVQEKFYQYTGRELVVNVGVHFKDLGGNSGICRNGNTVYLDRATFDQRVDLNPIAIEATILHELGHCLYGLEHDDSWTDVDGSEVPESIMHTNIDMFTHLVIDNEEYYYNQIAGQL